MLRGFLKLKKTNMNSNNSTREHTAEKILVAKVGWENAANMQWNIENIAKTAQVYWLNIRIFSAMRSSDFNTTDHLLGLVSHLLQWEISEALEELQSIKFFHEQLIQHHIPDSEVRSSILTFLDTEFEKAQNYITQAQDYSKLWRENDYSIGDFSILWFWELLSTKLYYEISKAQWRDVVYLDTTELWDNIENIEVLIDRFKNKLLPILESGTKDIYVPWFIRWLPWWILDFFKRWYSDATAWVLAQTALRIDSSTDNHYQYRQVVLNIQKSVDWFLTTDPRFLEDWFNRAQVIEEISVDLAQRIIADAWAKAKLLNKETLNSEVIKLLRENEKFRLLINNPFSESNGTLVSWKVENQKSKVNFVLPREKVRHKYRNWLWIGWANSIYLMWEKLWWLESWELLGFVTDLMKKHGISWVNWCLQSGLKATAILNFVDDFDPRIWIENDKKRLGILEDKLKALGAKNNLSQEEHQERDRIQKKIPHLAFEIDTRLKNLDYDRLQNLKSAKEKSALALDILHSHFFETDDVKVAQVA